METNSYEENINMDLLLISEMEKEVKQNNKIKFDSTFSTKKKETN